MGYKSDLTYMGLIFQSSSCIDIAGARQVGLYSDRLPRFTGDVGYMLASHMLHGELAGTFQILSKV